MIVGLQIESFAGWPHADAEAGVVGGSANSGEGTRAGTLMLPTVNHIFVPYLPVIKTIVPLFVCECV